MSSLTYSHRNREPARAQVKNNEPEGGGGTATLRMDKKNRENVLGKTGGMRNGVVAVGSDR